MNHEHRVKGIREQLAASDEPSGQASPTPLPQIDSNVPLSKLEETVLQHLHPNCEQVLVEAELGGGFSGAQVLLTVPKPKKDGPPKPRKVTKLGSALEMRRERDKYAQYVDDYLPFCAIRVEEDTYYEQEGVAGLNYVFVHDGITLEEYYRKALAEGDVERVKNVIEDLLDRKLGYRWYQYWDPTPLFFRAEYSRQLVENLRLKLRPDFADELGALDKLPPSTEKFYTQLALPVIYQQPETISPGDLVTIKGLVPTRIKRKEVTLEDAAGRGVVIGVEFPPEMDAAHGLNFEQSVGVRGQVVYNRRGEMERIVRAVFRGVKPGLGRLKNKSVRLPCGAGDDRSQVYPNPLQVYPDVLSATLEARLSPVHGDLNLRNVLVDGSGKGWLIDFAKVERRHNVFDFIKLEARLRTSELAREECAFSLGDYLAFEEALNEATLGRSFAPPTDEHLAFTYEVILTIRQTAQKYMGPNPDFRKEYFPALLLYCLGTMRYYKNDGKRSAQLAFATACVQGKYWRGENVQVHPPTSSQDDGKLPTPPPGPGAGRRWAVMVGINDYEDNLNFSDLAYGVADVQAIHRLLIDQPRGSYQTRLLLDTLHSGLPTRNNILTELANVAQAADERDLLLFYFSGHGAVEAGEAYLIPRDARLSNLVDTAIPLRRAKKIMSDSAARAKVIILDACHSGARIGKADARMSPAFMRRVFAEAEGLAILTSCQQGQVSYEWEQASQSVFTHYLLEGLAGAADFDDKGFVTIQDVNRYVADRVKIWAVNHGLSQTPTVGGGWSGDIIVAEYAEKHYKAPDMISTPSDLIAGQRQRLEQKYRALQQDWDLYDQKAERLQTSLALETSVSARFQAEQELADIRAWLARLKEEMASIETKLPLVSSGGESSSTRSLKEEPIRLDVAAPETVTVNQPFEIAVRISRPDSPPLSEADLPHVTFRPGRVYRTPDQEVIRYRVKVSAPACEVHDSEYVFLLRPGMDSEVVSFQLTAKREGNISIIVTAYQEDDLLAAQTRIRLVAEIEARKSSAEKARPWRPQRLVHTLCRLPGAETDAGRAALLRGLPHNIIMALPRTSAPMDDWANIVAHLGALGRLSSGDWPLLILIDNALQRVEGTQLGQELEESRKALVDTYEGK
jgi:hypothetical protein